MHIVADEIAHAIAPTPLVNLIDALADAALAAKVTHLGLLGTTYVTERSFFADRLEQRGVAALVPDEQARATLQRIIYDELTVGIVSDTSRCELLSIIDSLASHGAQAAALACTEFGLLIAPGTASLDTFDTMELHCRALLSAVGLRLPT
jgi:aspartate racemase